MPRVYVGWRLGQRLESLLAWAESLRSATREDRDDTFLSKQGRCSNAERLFLDWAKTELDELTEEPVRAHFSFLREQKKQAPSSINVAVCMLLFFCTQTLGRDWPVFELLGVNKPRLLPVGLGAHPRRRPGRQHVQAGARSEQRELTHG